MAKHLFIPTSHSGGSLTMKKLTKAQRYELIEQYVEMQVENMDYGCLVRFATEELEYSLQKYNDEELKEDIDQFDEELYDELVDNVTNNSKRIVVELPEGTNLTKVSSIYAECVDHLVDTMEGQTNDN